MFVAEVVWRLMFQQETRELEKLVGDEMEEPGKDGEGWDC